MQNGKNAEVQSALDAYTELCDDIKCTHDSIMSLLPLDKKAKHETCFKAKMMFNDEFIADTQEWVL